MHRLLEARRRGDEPVAFDSAGVREWQAFTADVRALCDELRASPAGRWLVLSEDAYAFAVSLFAIAHSGGVAVLPPNGRRGTLERLAPQVDGFLVDDASLLTSDSAVPVVAPLGHVEHGCAALGELDPDAPFVEFFTSGTTGESKQVAKRLRHLDDEIAVLESVFGATVGAARVFATVSHQHIYGALFRVLWPLAAGRPFSARPFLHGPEVVARMVDGPSVLVSSPLQLRAMSEAGSLRAVSPIAIFSSAAPLDGKTAKEVATAAGVAVTEVFGSTETGGVAWRQCPRGDEQPWRPFPRVQLETDESGNLAVRSPFVSVGPPDERGMCGFVMGDRAEIDSSGTFLLRGRADRIVKIGGKRLSLPEMEAELARHPLVSEVALVVSRRGIESRVCAAVVLSASGGERLRDVGRGEMGRILTAALLPYFDRVLLPRAWRFVEQLPRNAQDKLVQGEVQGLFASEVSAPPVLTPAVESEERGGDSLVRHCAVPRDLAFLAGHFDALPIVAGVVQLGWVIAAAEDLLGAVVRVSAVEALKFKQPLLPGEIFDLALTVDDERSCVRFRLSRGEDEISSGRILLA